MLLLSKFLPSFLLFILSFIFLHFFYKTIISRSRKLTDSKGSNDLPKPYPIIGHLIEFTKHKGPKETFEWLVSLVLSSPSSTFVVHQPLGGQVIFTGHPATVEYILKTCHHIYQKGPHHENVFKDVFGDSLITKNGEAWKFQRQVSSHIFSPKSLQNYIENIVDFELEKRLIPILSQAAKTEEVIDLQHILQRFTFDNICSIAFGYDPGYLSPSLPRAHFSESFDDAITISFSRFTTSFPIIWKICRFLNIGREERLKDAIREIREFTTLIVREKKQEILTGVDQGNNLLSRLLKYDQFDEKLVIDIVTTFIFAGRDPTSAGLTWFFWLIHKNKRVESEIIKEINKINTNSSSENDETSNRSVREETNDMIYTHAALSETMRLYPPVPMDTKQAVSDDVLPDGTIVKKGMLVTYVMYAMGRLEKLWGSDWADFRPERWLGEEMKWKYVPRDPFSYPVFNAGSRTCPGKEMAYLQMKRVVAGVLKRFKVVPLVEDGVEPVYIASMTAKMEGGFRVRIQERVGME